MQTETHSDFEGPRKGDFQDSDRERIWTNEGSTLLELLLDSAWHLGASHIHIETRIPGGERKHAWSYGSLCQKAIVKFKINGKLRDHSAFYPSQIHRILDVVWKVMNENTRPESTREAGHGILPYAWCSEFRRIKEITASFSPMIDMGEYLVLEFIPKEAS